MEAALTELTGGLGVRLAAGARMPAGDSGSTGARSPDGADAIDSPGTRDSIVLSGAAQSVLNGERAAAEGEDRPPDRDPLDSDTDDAAKKAEGAGGRRGADGEPLDDDEVKEVERLEKRDREVRAHEQAHQAAGGPHAGAPSYDYETGPDGKSYAISGEVPIDTAPVAGDPAATIAKMDQVKRAALAPAEPSAADRAIAARAEQSKLKAQQELVEQQAAATREEATPPRPAERGALVSVTA